MDKEKAALHDVLISRIRKSGPITFHDYMAACLYEPGLGYYTSPGRKVGAEGDFYTSINVHAVFGRLIAKEIARMWEVLGKPADFRIVEAGAGHGRLARDILEALAENSPALFEIVVYHLIEKEPSLQDAQRGTLGDYWAKAQWTSSEDFAAGQCRFTGCYLSNELVDSFPVHLVQMTEEGLKEVHVTENGGEFVEILREPSTPLLEDYLQRIGVRLLNFQRAEINLVAPEWLKTVTNALDRGFVLTVDYGYTAVDLFSPMRRTGTLLCYYRHQVEESPYVRPGLQDITTHIDFTTLSERGKEYGLETVFLGEQYRFLMATGLMEVLMLMEARSRTEEEKLKNRLALKKLIMPDGGMGDTFKVLVQGKGVTNPDLLCLRKWGKL